MKQLFFLLFLSIGITTFAQQDSTLLPLQSDTVHITLTAKQHAFIIAFMPDKSQVERTKYIYSVLSSIDIAKDTAGKNYLATPNKVIKYTPSISLLQDLFLTIGSNQERLVAADNRDIQASLTQQLQRRPDVLQRIALIVAANAKQSDEVVQVLGIDYLAKLKE